MGLAPEKASRIKARDTQTTWPDPWSNLLWPRSLEDAGWTWDQSSGSSIEVDGTGLVQRNYDKKN